MADIRRVPHSVVSLPGTGGGQPHYERNTLLPVTELIVGTGTPRLYDEIVSQWGVVRAEYEDLRSAAADLEVETERCGATAENPDGDETSGEARFNDALEDLLLGDRLHIEAGDGHDRGIGHLLAWGVESIAYGFSIAEPYWIEGGGIYTARVCVRPLERSAAYRWGVDRDGYRPGPHPTCLYYLTAEAGQQEIPYEELLHITNPGARPGHWYGLAPLLRACVPLSRPTQRGASVAFVCRTGRRPNSCSRVVAHPTFATRNKASPKVSAASSQTVPPRLDCPHTAVVRLPPRWARRTDDGQVRGVTKSSARYGTGCVRGWRGRRVTPGDSVPSSLSRRRMRSMFPFG